LVAVGGGKEPLRADLAEFSMGSDHQVYTEGSFRIPAIYLNDWPDRYIHTNLDRPANVDPTKLQRAAFIGAASALMLANLRPADVPALWTSMQSAATRRAATMLERRAGLAPAEASVLTRVFLATERAALASISGFAPIRADVQRNADDFFANLERLVGGVQPPPAPTGDGALVFSRTAVTGPTSVFGYDYFADHYRGVRPRLLGYAGLRGSGGEYAYEVLSLVDGRRTAREIRDFVSAEYGPVPLELVVEYLRALVTVGVTTP
jgi:hypothetical protein